MNTNNDLIELFFNDYENRFNNAIAGNVDVDGQASSFTECFIGANPKGVECSKNDKKLRDSIPALYEFYKSIGTQSMKIVSKEITTLNESHSLVKTHWQSRFIKQDNSMVSIEFDNFYLVQILNNTVKIFAYVTGDEEAVYKKHGIVPYK